MNDPKQTEYEQAIAQIPDEIVEERGKEYHDYVRRNIRPLQERINLIRNVQQKTLDEESGQVVRIWHPASKKEVEEIRTKIKILWEKAVDRFWEGYEDLRPGDDD